MGCLLENYLFKNNSMMIVTDLSKQQAINADPNATEENNFTGNLDRTGQTTIFPLLKE